MNYFKSIGVTIEICLPLTFTTRYPSQSKNESINKAKHSHFAMSPSMCLIPMQIPWQHPMANIGLLQAQMTSA